MNCAVQFRERIASVWYRYMREHKDYIASCALMKFQKSAASVTALKTKTW
jgi:hypothetical protein